MRFATFAVLLAVGCSNASASGNDASTDGSTAEAAAPSCVGDFDCPSTTQRCLFPIDGKCSTPHGTCVTFTPPDSCMPNIACGCDGTTISVCAPPGFVDRLSNYAGACEGGVDDAGFDAADATGE